MNEPYWAHAAYTGRRAGKTTALIRACKETGGVLVCANHQMARDIAREHGIRTATIHEPDRTRGLDVPFFFEPESVAAATGARLERLRTYIQEFMAKVADL